MEERRHTLTSQLPSLNAGLLNTIDPSNVALPAYNRDALPISVLHIGPGAFFRAHQMDYFDRLNAIDPQWGVATVALRSRKAPEALSEQNGLYTLVTLDREISYRIIGSLVQADYFEDEAAENHFVRDTLKLITLTITEKGYCLDGSGKLNEQHPDIQHDLASPDKPVSALGWILKGLKARKTGGLDGLTVLSCDNLPGNGEKLGAAILRLADLIDTDLAYWIETHVRFPSSMVDSITPATTDAEIATVETNCGYHDAWPIQREAFTSWVIEDIGAAGFPPLETVGAVLTSDVELHEQAKLRMLNGTHSSLAYIGLAYGETNVSGAMAHPALGTLIADMMRDEIIPTVTPPPGMELSEYGEALLERYRNPAIEHKLSQIAWDGSKKLPIRVLQTIRDRIKQGKSYDRLALAVAAWMRFIIRMSRARMTITDPMAEELARIGAAATDIPKKDVSAFLSIHEIFGADLPNEPTFVLRLQKAYDEIKTIDEKLKLEEA